MKSNDVVEYEHIKKRGLDLPEKAEHTRDREKYG